jgi:hypothetical protein
VKHVEPYLVIAALFLFRADVGHHFVAQFLLALAHDVQICVVVLGVCLSMQNLKGLQLFLAVAMRGNFGQMTWPLVQKTKKFETHIIPLHALPRNSSGVPTHQRSAFGAELEQQKYGYS